MKSNKYHAVHKRVGRYYGKASLCEECGSTYSVQWAHIHDAPMTDDRWNWKQLCSKCHSAYDRTPEQQREIARLGGLSTAGIPRHAYNEEFRRKVSETNKAKGIRPPSRKGAKNERSVCADCGVEYGSNWMNRHKAIGRCVNGTQVD